MVNGELRRFHIGLFVMAALALVLADTLGAATPRLKGPAGLFFE